MSVCSVVSYLEKMSLFECHRLLCHPRVNRLVHRPCPIKPHKGRSGDRTIHPKAVRSACGAPVNITPPKINPTLTSTDVPYTQCIPVSSSNGELAGFWTFKGERETLCTVYLLWVVVVRRNGVAFGLCAGTTCWKARKRRRDAKANWTGSCYPISSDQ